MPPTLINLNFIQTLQVIGKPENVQSIHSFCPTERHLLAVNPVGRKDDARRKAKLPGRKAGFGQTADGSRLHTDTQPGNNTRAAI